MIDNRQSTRTTRLHHYLRRMWPSVDVVKDLLKHSSLEITMTDQFGHTPLHLSTRMDVCPEVTRVILEASPEALYVKDKAGETPLSRLCEWWTFAVPANWRSDQVKANYGLSSDAEETLKLHPLEAQWEKIILMLRVASKHLSRTKFRPLHTAAFMGCPPTVIRQLHLLYKGQITELEEESGRRPLSIAAASPHVCGKEGLGTLQELLRIDPSAGKAIDHENRFPLHLAIESGKTWDTGVESIVLAAPSVLLAYDSKTHLLPFMTSAKTGSINDIYLLLRNCPEVIAHEDGRTMLTKQEQGPEKEDIPTLAYEDDEFELVPFGRKEDVFASDKPRSLKRRANNYDECIYRPMKKLKNMKICSDMLTDDEEN